MKNIIFGAILATTVSTVFAEPHPRQVRYMCASFEELEMTVNKYEEKLIIATKAPGGRTVNMLYANFETQTSSWIIRDLQTDEYCMIGVGDAIYIPDSSELKQGTGVGTKTTYK